jgi:hypothetical protein
VILKTSMKLISFICIFDFSLLGTKVVVVVVFDLLSVW